jgi:hypothetical protein
VPNFTATVFLQGDTVRLLPGCFTGRPVKTEVTIDDEKRKKKLEQLLKVLRAQKLEPRVKYDLKNGLLIAKVTV